ncbi:MAG: TatD family hydrolase [Methanomassiliicoccales archaeon]|jgi:TatD-related deoxyribonuclease|nr:TatD family hydrolase [Methanomassiliicoccales archaeon]
MFEFPVLDNHVHLQPRGRNVEGVKDFLKAGGTHLIVSHMPYQEAPVRSAEDFRSAYGITLRMVEGARSAGAGAFATLGPYPVQLLELAEAMPLERAVEVMKGGMDIAASLVREGRAIALGEIGRPHFPVPDDVMAASNAILAYGMQLAKECGCPVVVHAESATPASMEELGAMADRVGLPRERVVKHYCGPLVAPHESRGLYPSVLATRPMVQEALAKGDRFLLETDFMDDLERPGAVLAITTVPKRMRQLVEKGTDPSVLWKVNKDNPERVYGITIG